MGIHTVSKLVKEACESIGVDTDEEKITNRSVRIAQFNHNVHSGTVVDFASALAGHSSGKSRGSYITPNLNHQRAMSNMLTLKASGSKSRRYDEEVSSIEDGEQSDISDMRTREHYSTTTEEVNPFIRAALSRKRTSER